MDQGRASGTMAAESQARSQADLDPTVPRFRPYICPWVWIPDLILLRKKPGQQVLWCGYNSPQTWNECTIHVNINNFLAHMIAIAFDIRNCPQRLWLRLASLFC